MMKMTFSGHFKSKKLFCSKRDFNPKKVPKALTSIAIIFQNTVFFPAAQLFVIVVENILWRDVGNLTREEEIRVVQEGRLNDWTKLIETQTTTAYLCLLLSCPPKPKHFAGTTATCGCWSRPCWRRRYSRSGRELQYLPFSVAVLRRATNGALAPPCPYLSFVLLPRRRVARIQG